MADKKWIEEKRAIVQEMERKIKALVKKRSGVAAASLTCLARRISL